MKTKLPLNLLALFVVSTSTSTVFSQDTTAPAAPTVPAPAPIPLPAPAPVPLPAPAPVPVPGSTTQPTATSTQPKANYSLHTVKPSGSLSYISAIAYKRPGYWRILKLHNGIAPEKLQAGQQIKAPDLDWLLADCKLTLMYPQVTKDLMTARKMFMEVEDKLEGAIQKDTITPTEEDQKKIGEAIALINTARTTLLAKKEGVTSPPSATVLQLRTVTRKMATISGGTTKAAATQNLVHEHFSNALVYAVLWARDGFK